MKTMNTYECSIPFFDTVLTDSVPAETRSKARYQFWHMHSDGLMDFKTCLPHIKVKKVGAFRIQHLFGDVDKFNRVCEIRNIEFCRMGMVIDVDGQKGWIVGGNSSNNLDVVMEGKTWSENVHPTWETTYYDSKMNVIKCFKTKK